MSDDDHQPEGSPELHGPARPGESMVSGGAKGIALVTLATVALAAAGALIALIVSLLY